MLSPKDISVVYETLLSSPGMNEEVKIGFRLSRKKVLLLSQVLEVGIRVKGEDGKPTILSIADEPTLKELGELGAELLSKAGLTGMREKIDSLLVK